MLTTISLLPPLIIKRTELVKHFKEIRKHHYFAHIETLKELERENLYDCAICGQKPADFLVLIAENTGRFLCSDICINIYILKGDKNV